MKLCRQCGKGIMGRQSTAVFCSSRCSQKWNGKKYTYQARQERKKQLAEGMKKVGAG
jgi:ribosomal protein L37AE/L43A